MLEKAGSQRREEGEDEETGLAGVDNDAKSAMFSREIAPYK